MFEKLYDSLKETPHAEQNPETVHSGEILRLRNHKTCQPCQEGGCAALTAEKDSFRIHALFHDSDIFNTAKVNNERTWTTGDVCEFFIQPAGQDDYFEFHVTPEGITLQLHLPPVSRMGSIPFEKQIFESGMTHRVQVRREENYWYGRNVHSFCRNADHGKRGMGKPLRSLPLQLFTRTGKTGDVIHGILPGYGIPQSFTLASAGSVNQRRRW